MRTIHYASGILFSFLLLFNGCLGDDIDDLKKQQADQDKRIAALETWQQTVNTNITALQGLVSALEAKDFVTAVTPKLEGSVEVGYTITFSKSGAVVIYHGKKGDDGLTPVIGVAKDTDGLYYWTVQTGTAAAGWIKDSKGNKIPTTGTDGRDAIAPQVRINTTTDEWELSTDGGATWKSTGVRATGPQGATGATGSTGATGPQGDAIFAAGGVDNTHTDYVEFTLADGTTKIQLPKYIALGITFNQPDPFTEGETKTIYYALQGAAPAVMTAINVPTGWKVSFDKTNKQINVTAPATVTADNGAGEAVILLSDGGERTVTRILSLLSTGAVNNEIGAYYYLKGVKAGVVYQVKKENRKGLVVSLDESSSFLQWDSSSSGTTGATSTTDGLTNTVAITDYSNYPAFGWANAKNPAGTTYATGDKGKWYLPAKDELKSLYAGFCGRDMDDIQGWGDVTAMPEYNTPDCADARTVFNDKLMSAGGTKLIFDPTNWGIYWSSTEDYINLAWNVYFTDGFTDYSTKNNYGRFRAVLAF